MKSEVFQWALKKAPFEGKLTKTERDALIVRAVHRYGYSQKRLQTFWTCTTLRSDRSVGKDHLTGG